MSTNPTLTISVNGGPPQTGGIYADDGDTLDFGVLNRDGWLRARWELTDYPEGFACPAGWSTGTDDAVRPMYYVSGTANPPTVTSNGWGPYKSRVIVNDVDVDERTFVKILSPSGFEGQAAGEEGQFGGTKLQKDRAYNANLQLIEDYSAALAIADVAPTPDTILKRGPSGEGKCVSFQGASIASTTTSFSALNSAGRGLTVTPTTTTLLFGSCTVAVDASNCAISAPAAIDLTAGTNIIAAATGTVGITSGSTTVITASAALTMGGSVTALKSTTGGIDINAKTGVVNLQKDGTTALVVTVDSAGAFSVAPVAGSTSVAYQQAQNASAAGAAAALRAQRGFAGFIGGNLTIGGGEGGTSATNLAGKTIVDLGTMVGGVSAYMEVHASGSSILSFRRTNSAVVEMECPGLVWLKGASGCLIGSNDDTVRVECQQSTGIVTAKGANGGVRLQDTSVTWVELARVAAGRNVVGLAVGANLDTTKMPANTGNGVLFIGNCGTAPSAVPNNSGCGVFVDSCQVKTFASGNGWMSLTPLVSAGYTKVVRDKGSPAPTTQAATTPIVVVLVKTTPITGLSGIGTATVRIKGYRGGDNYISVHQLQFEMAAGTLNVIGSDVLGTARGTAPTSIAFSIVSTDIVVTITPVDATSTKWSVSFDWEFDAVA